MLPNARDLEGKPVPKVTFKTRVNIGGQLIGGADELERYLGSRKAA